jgi:RimJ/RimL family protein N-acetyltransferase
MKDNYIDTVVSTQNGVGKALIKNLSAGRYKANTSPLNKKSMKFFESLGFKKTGMETLLGEARIIYENNI